MLYVQCDICKNLESENNKIEIKLKAEIESLKETITKLENTNKELHCQSQALNTENSILKKVCITLTLLFPNNNFFYSYKIFLTGLR